MKIQWISICSIVGAVFFSCNIIATEEFLSWKKKNNESFQSYKSEERAAFRQALNSEWESFKLIQPKNLYSEPKIDTVPVAPLKSEPLINMPKKNEPDITVPMDTPKLQPEKTKKSNQIEINYLTRQFRLPEFNPRYLPLSVGKTNITSAWESLYPDLETLVKTIFESAELSDLSDWALISLLNEYALEVNNYDSNGSRFMLWGMLIELGFDARLAYDDINLYLLLPSQQKIYGKSSIKIDDVNYYIFIGELPNNPIYTYIASQPSQKRFDFSFSDKQPIRGLIPEKRTLSDSHTGLDVSYLIYPQLEDYYRNHPSLDFIWYFRVSLKDDYYLTLIDNLKNKLNNYPVTTQVKMLLSLIQHGFEYELDNDQWGEEYYSTPMHTLMLKAADCEDRSFLFSYLVEQVVGIDTVGLKYPGHLAVAVALDESETDNGADHVSVNGRKFFIADPTYIGATIGETMPMFKNVIPMIITD